MAGNLRSVSNSLNRKEDNDQESIQLPNIFRTRHQMERRTHLKQRQHNQNTTNRKPKGQFLFRKSAKRLSKIRISHAKTYNDRHSKPQQKHRLGTVSNFFTGGLNRFYVITILALSAAVLYTRHLFSPREEFLTHQCNISENIKIKRIQRWNNDEDSTARNNWNAEAKENQQYEAGRLEQSQSIRYQPTYLKVSGPELS